VELIEEGATSAAVPEAPAKPAGPEEWPVAFEAPLTQGDLNVGLLKLCPGFGAVWPASGAGGLTIHGGWSDTALWLPEAMGDQGSLSMTVTPSAEGWTFLLWPGGPGRGRAVNAGYNVVVRAAQIELRRDGEVVRSGAFDPPLSVGEEFVIKVSRDGGQLSVTVDGKQALAYVDKTPLAGPLRSRFGFGGANCVVRNLELRRPGLSEQQLAAATDVPLLPEPSLKPATNGEVLFEATPAQIKATWPQSQPESTNVLKDGLVLFGWNGTPALCHPAPLRGDVAFEVEFEYVPARWPGPHKDGLPSAADHYLANGASENGFTLLMPFTDALPAPDDAGFMKSVFRWGVRLPASNGAVALSTWVNDQEDVRLSLPHLVIAPGHRYRARMERMGQCLRIFLDDVYLGEATAPECPGEEGPFLLGFNQWCAGNVVYAASAYRLGPVAQ